MFISWELVPPDRSAGQLGYMYLRVSNAMQGVHPQAGANRPDGDEHFKFSIVATLHAVSIHIPG
jgi:hypothetical protein